MFHVVSISHDIAIVDLPDRGRELSGFTTRWAMLHGRSIHTIPYPWFFDVANWRIIIFKFGKPSSFIVYKWALTSAMWNNQNLHPNPIEIPLNPIMSHYPYAPCTEDLPTFTIQITQFCRFLYTSTMVRIWDMKITINHR